VKLRLECHDKIIQLIDKGVHIFNPLSLDIGDDVDIDQISSDGVKIYPGCRIYGGKTVIAAGAQIGHEGPVTIENCQIGPNVELKDGYFSKAVFLEKANMGLGAHIREGCILEEESNGAHCVGLKQTILFPFVTLGSLINFCDCLMAGGTSRKDHSEVGSSYIHFNFSPDGDKTTPSLIGDVPRGVMLNQPRIFLGGQGGIIGPLRIGYGNVVAAGTILRKDSLEDNKLIVGKTHRAVITDFTPKLYPGLSRVVENNMIYIANLMALEQWYMNVRRPFFILQEFGELIYNGVLNNLELAKKERIKRLRMLADNQADFNKNNKLGSRAASPKRELNERIDQVCDLFSGEIAVKAGEQYRDRFLSAFEDSKNENPGNYVEMIQSLPNDVSQEGTRWLKQIIDEVCQKSSAILPLMNLFKKM